MRAGLAARPVVFQWSSAAAHVTGKDDAGIAGLRWFREPYIGEEWAHVLGEVDGALYADLRRCRECPVDRRK